MPQKANLRSLPTVADSGYIAIKGTEIAKDASNPPNLINWGTVTTIQQILS